MRCVMLAMLIAQRGIFFSKYLNIKEINNYSCISNPSSLTFVLNSQH